MTRGYRFWDAKKNCYAPDGDFWINYKGDWATNLCSKYLSYKWSDIIPEQSTGLRDKNGKEIYEGDIVRDMHPFEKNRHPDEVVEYEGGGFSPIAIPGWEGTPQVEYLEVIGNIHENPELLK